MQRLLSKVTQARYAMGTLVIAAICLFWFEYDAIIAQHPDKAPELITVALSTCLAAWVGGWAAFSAERIRREEEEKKTQISAGNKALFTVTTMYDAADNLRRFYVEAGNGRGHPARAIEMNSPLPGIMQPVHFDLESLTYLLDASGSVSAQALRELQDLDWAYSNMLGIINERAHAYMRLMTTLSQQAQTNLTELEAAKHRHPYLYSQLAKFTDQMIAEIDNCIAKARATEGNLRKALELQFPAEALLQVVYPETV